MRAGCLYLQTPISNLGKMQGHFQNTEHKLCIIRYMHMVIVLVFKTKILNLKRSRD